MKNKDILSPIRKKNIATAHMNACYGDFADTVIICSSSSRVNAIVNQFLYDYSVVTNVREALGYTGYYNNKKISVMTTGMGMPSSEIYIASLIYGYNVKTIIKCDSCLGIANNMNIGDTFIFESVTTHSFLTQATNGNEYYNADPKLIKKIKKQQYKETHFGKGFAALFFGLEDHSNIQHDYTMNSKYKINNQNLLQENIKAVEMENYILYKMCYEANVKTISICSIVAIDNIDYENSINLKSNNYMDGIFRDKIVSKEAKICLDLL